MACRKWMVRGLVFGVASVMVTGAVLYYQWTNPAAIRQQVLDKLAGQFIGVRVSVDSAHLRLLGGISVGEVRFTRKDDPDQTDFLYIPSAVIYHDKEQMMDGKVAFLKIEMHRPRLRFVRGTDGVWNLRGLRAAGDSEERIPMLVFQQATVILEDHQAPEGTPPIEIKDLNFTLVNDPPERVTFDATGISDVAGPIHARGSWDRSNGAINLALDLKNIPIGPTLAQRLASYFPNVASHIRQLEGTGKIEATVAYDARAQPPLHFDVTAGLAKGTFHHAELPMPFEQIEASVHCVDGQIPLVQLNARSGSGTIAAMMKDLDISRLIDSGEKHPQDLFRQLEVKIDHLNVTEDLYKPLPRQYGEDIWHEYKPSGPASATYSLRHEKGHWLKRLVVMPEGAHAEYIEFKYPVDNVTGMIVHESSDTQPDRLHLDLVGYASKQRVHIQGDMIGDRPDHEVNLKIWGENLPLDPKVDAALASIGTAEEGAAYQRIARSFHPSGFGDFNVIIHRDPKKREFANRYVINFHDCRARYDPFQRKEGELPGYPLENISGVLDLQPPSWEFHDFRGTHKGGEFRTSGRAFPVGDEKQIEVAFTGKNFLLDDELRNALEPGLRQTWDNFAPEGRVDYSGEVIVPPPSAQDPKTDINLTVFPQRCAIRPSFFRYRIEDLVGKLHYHHDRVDLEKLTATNGKSRLSLGSGYILMKPGGGAYADLNDVEGKPIFPTQELLDAMPSVMKTGCVALDLKDPIAFKTNLIIDTKPEGGKPDVYWDGTGVVRDVSLLTGVRWEHVTGEAGCKGRHDGQKLLGITGNFAMKQGTVLGQTLNDFGGHLSVTKQDPEILHIEGLHGAFCGGETYGEGRVEFGPMVRYELNLSASQINLAEFGQQNFGSTSQLSGLAMGRLYLTGEGSEPSRLNGKGSVDVPNGKIYSLPLLLDLLKFLGLRLPDRTLFEEAHADFTLEGQTAKISRLNLFGNVISLRGQGSMNFANPDAIGLNLDFNVDWARVAQVLPPTFKELGATVSNYLYKVKVRGTSKKPEFSQEPLPMLTGPIKDLIKSSSGSDAPRTPNPAAMNPNDSRYRGMAPPR
jgi:hypothetical protein